MKTEEVCEGAARAWLAENPRLRASIITLVPVERIKGTLNDASLAGLIQADREGEEMLEAIARAVRKAGLAEPTIGQVMRGIDQARKVKA